MAEQDVAGKEAASVQPVPDTDHFQVLLGPNGECRIVLLRPAPAEPDPVATLTLGAADADELARVLTTRRKAHEQAKREEEGGAKH